MEYHEITGALASRRPFALARYGDGEIACMGGWPGKNKDGHAYHGELGKRLQETIAKPKPQITYALQNIARRNRKLKAIINAHSKVSKWYDADVLHRQSLYRSINKLFEVLKRRKTWLIGPERLKPLGIYEGHFEIRDRNCWLDHNKTLERMRTEHVEGDVYVLCAGMSAAVIIYDLVGELEDATFIDAGSVFDPYVGHCTRTYHRQVLRKLKAAKR